jgi:hypothetical protein
MNIGYKVMDSQMRCRDFQFELGKTYTHDGDIKLCGEGFHFCLIANNCFNYYGFDSKNRVFEIEFGPNVVHGYNKSVTKEITIARELDWNEVLNIVNTGSGNSGRSNSGNWNSGNWNSGDRNSGNWNSGNRNSGDSNSGNWNSGNRNSGNWNSGNWNSGDSNSGYRNSGGFCTDTDPVLWLFDKPTKMTVKQWEQSKAISIMSRLEFNIWVPSCMMSEKEKKDNPKHETIEGYLKTISLQDAWSNLWNNLSKENKKVFTDLPNFCPKKFKEITGIDV